MITANQARQDSVTIEKYLDDRIMMAINGGHTTALMWIRLTNEDKALKLLDKSGFTYKILQRDTHSNQYEVSW